jgi:hypothetical protein
LSITAVRISSFILISNLTSPKVQRALHAWQTGRLVLPERKQDWWFSKANWGRDTKRFMEPVNLLDSTRWTSLLKAVKPYTAFAKNDPIDVDMSDDDAGDPRFLCPSSGKYCRLCVTIFAAITNSFIDV